MNYFEEENNGHFNSREGNARPRRPRFTRTERNNNVRVYGNKAETSGFPEGFGSKFQDAQRNQRPAYSRPYGGGAKDGRSYNRQPSAYNRQGGYQQRNQYEGNQQGYRPSGRNTGQSACNRQGGYRPYDQRGGYQQGYRPSGRYAGQQNYNRQGGYDPSLKYSLKKRIEYKEQNIDPNAPIRINKFLANAGICSRREADEFIQAGVVSVNGTVITELGTKVTRNDDVRFHDQPVTLEKKVYVLLNKPKDYVTTTDDPQQRKTVLELVKNACRERIYPVGRLDRNTTGVLLLTNDGDLASKLTHPKFLKKKVYHVRLDRNITKHDMEQLVEGITLEDGEIHVDQIEYADETDKSQVGVEIHSGKNRIVRRMFEAIGYHVIKLDRTMFAGLTKKSLRRGDWRYLTEKEVNILRSGAFE